MNTLKIETSGSIAILRLDRGKANAMNAEMVQELAESFTNLATDPEVKAVVLSGKDEFFSAGLDVIELYGYDESQILHFWGAFDQLIRLMVSFPKPLVCAVTGHSPAGGCVLALCCDYRVMADGKYRIGLNEIPVGIVVPSPIFHLYSFWLGSARAYQFLLEGLLMTAEKAVEAGLANESCELAEVELRAIAKASAYVKFNPVVWSQSKLNFRKNLLEQLSPDFDEAFGPTLKQWWAPETRAQLTAMIEGLKKK